MKKKQLFTINILLTLTKDICKVSVNNSEIFIGITCFLIIYF